MENSNDKEAARLATGNVSPSRDVKRKGVNACRGSAYSPTRKRSLPYPFYKPAVFHLAGFLRFRFTLRHQLIDIFLFHAVRFRIAQRAAMRNTRAVKQRFQFALFALGHLFLCNSGVPWWCPARRRAAGGRRDPVKTAAMMLTPPHGMLIFARVTLNDQRRD